MNADADQSEQFSRLPAKFMENLRRHFGEFLIRCLCVPLVGIVITLVATFLCIVVLGSAPQNGHLLQVLQWVLPIFLGFVAGLYFNRNASTIADLFSWLGPAVFI